MSGGPGRPRALVVEDEPMIAMLLEDMLDELGVDPAAVVGLLPAALDAAEHGTFDLALLDVNVGGEVSYGIADRLAARGIPFAFVTGYGASGLADRHGQVPVLRKPFDAEALAAVLRLLLEGGGAGR